MKLFFSPIKVGLPLLLSTSLFANNSEGFTFFEKNIRPIFQNECSKCHGEKKQKGGLNLSLKTLALSGGDLGPLLVKHKPNESLIIKALERKNKDLKMPPKKALSENQVKAFKTWIQMGAPWPDDKNVATTRLPAAKRIDEVRDEHWSFQPIPNIQLSSPQEIDQLIQKQLKEHNLSPSKPAKPRDLIRRVYYDLIGLQPSIEEITKFEKDPSPAAYQKIIEQLLAMPQYGERWGRHWLDVARYGDTKGVVFGGESIDFTYSYTYRDYVIKSFNNDLPYHQFLKEQLAADQYSTKENKNESLAALGLLRVGPNYSSGHDRIDDMIDVVSRGFLGLTIGCARCHDHKADPITTKDYYALYGVFDSIQKVSLDEMPIIAENSDLEARKKFNEGFADINNKILDLKQKSLAEIEKEYSENVYDYLSYYIKKYTKQKIKGEVSKQGENDLQLRNQGISKWKSFLLPLNVSHAFFGPLLKLTHHPKSKHHEILQQILKNQENYFSPLMNIIKAKHDKNELNSSFDLARIYANFLNNSKQWGDVNSPAYKQMQETFNQTPLKINFDNLKRHLSQSQGDKLRKLNGKKDSFVTSSPGAPHKAFSIKDKDKATHPQVFIRGNPSRRGDRVPRRFIELINPIVGGKEFTKGSGRQELAELITHPKNPLTPRVIVNRIWAWHFGTGLVDSLSDFGLQTQKPLHLELLDKLSATFIQSGWSIKHLHKVILQSKTYRQSSAYNSVAFKKDSDNKLLWRFNKQRLSLEQMRDSILNISGGLDKTMGGKAYNVEENLPRRTVYSKVNRNTIPELFLNFDAPNPSSSIEKRLTTTVPQQSLFLINDNFVMDQACRISHKILTNKPDNPNFVKRLYQQILAKNPTPKEVDRALTFLKNSPSNHVELARDQWQYGYGNYNKEKNTLNDFNALTHYESSKKKWQVTNKYPDPKFHHIFFDQKGGHTSEPQKAVSLRWTAPFSGSCSLHITSKRNSKNHDGVKFFLNSNLQGNLKKWSNFGNGSNFKLNIQVKEGEVLDFLAHCGENYFNDYFELDPTIVLKTNSQTLTWQASRDFHQPEENIPLTPHQALAHVLLMSNEFHFAD